MSTTCYWSALDARNCKFVLYESAFYNKSFITFTIIYYVPRQVSWDAQYSILQSHTHTLLRRNERKLRWKNRSKYKMQHFYYGIEEEENRRCGAVGHTYQRRWKIWNTECIAYYSEMNVVTMRNDSQIWTKEYSATISRCEYLERVRE